MQAARIAQAGGAATARRGSVLVAPGAGGAGGAIPIVRMQVRAVRTFLS